jgi:hypothetical protein
VQLHVDPEPGYWLEFSDGRYVVERVGFLIVEEERNYGRHTIWIRKELSATRYKKGN